MLGRSVGDLALSGAELFEPALATLLRSADLTIGNLESAVSERGSPEAKGYTFRAPPLALAALTAAGFDVVSLANNHSLDYGAAALGDTQSHLRAAGIESVGAGSNIADALSAVVVERGGYQIAFVGLLDAPAEGSFSRANWEAGSASAGVAWADEESVRLAVRNAAESADFVVAMLHFGIEFSGTPSATQRALARAAIDAGADVVVGSHPHVLQEVEEYGGGLIAYSLGNFVFDGFGGLVSESAILRVSLAPGGVQEWELIPVTVGYDGLPVLDEQ